MRERFYILLIIAALLTYYHHQIVTREYVEHRKYMHELIIAHKAPSPKNGRALVPSIAESFRHKLGFVNSYIVVIYLSFLFTLYAMKRLVALFSNAARSWYAIGVMVALYPLTMFDYYFAPWSIIEPGLVAMAVYALCMAKPAQVLVFGALVWVNRFVDLTYDGAAFLSVLNRASAPRAVLHGVLFFNIIWLYFLKNIRRTRVMLLLTPLFAVYVIAILYRCIWYETRLFTTLWPLLLPVAFMEGSKDGY